LSKPLRILYVCAFSRKKKNGVQRFSEEIARDIGLNDVQKTSIYWNKEKGYLRSLAVLFKDFFVHLNKVNIVHFVVLTPFNLPFLLISKILKKKIVITYHGNYLEEASFYNNPIIAVIFVCSDAICRSLSDIIVSPTNYLVKKLNIDKRKSFIIPNPYDVSKIYRSSTIIIKDSSKEIVLATASNFNIKRKIEGLDYLLKAIEGCQFSHEIHLLVFGGGKYLSQFRKKFSHLKNVEFMGYCENFEDYLREVDIYVHFSCLDNQPYAIIEALLYGKVILCNDLEPFFETLDPEFNYITPLDSYCIRSTLVEIVKEYVNNLDNVRKKGNMNKDYATERYSSVIIVNAYENLYGRLLEK
jgi:glycosyltransferase involved in cell wall biosynthesis